MPDRPVTAPREGEALPCPFCVGEVVLQADGEIWHRARLDQCILSGEFFSPERWKRIQSFRRAPVVPDAERARAVAEARRVLEQLLVHEDGPIGPEVMAGIDDLCAALRSPAPAGTEPTTEETES